jgi:hypothetical protein
MPGDLHTFDPGVAVRKQAVVERDRIASILAAIDEVRSAYLEARRNDLSEAGEHLALERMTDSEDKLLQLILDPGFARYQRALQGCLTGFVEGAA